MFNRDYDSAARECEQSVTHLYGEYGIAVKSFNDSLLHEPAEIMNGEGKPYVVFTPYANAWKKREAPRPLGMPEKFKTPAIAPGSILGSKDFCKQIGIGAPAFSGGESAAADQWESFVDQRIAGYDTGRDIPGIDGTSKMSAYLRFGCISPRQMVHDSLALPGDAQGPVKFVDELIWREFYQSVLWHFLRLLHSSFRVNLDKLEWSRNDSSLNAWRNGRTGYPIVDAGMRQLNSTGWMHNRVRMITASFLTKDLFQDWKVGEQYFASKLLDLETASNNGGWQWAASTGVDPRPLRIFNPALQSERFDPEGSYIRTYCPELRKVPLRYIHAPHAMPATLQKELGIILGKHYPHPIVDHATAAAEYKRAFVRAKLHRTPVSLR
jgi:deoxyribodipyrimidine photo-lyase